MLDRVSRRVEDALPMGEGMREKVRSKRSVSNLVTICGTCFLLSWLGFGIYFVATNLLGTGGQGSVARVDQDMRLQRGGAPAMRHLERANPLLQSKPGQLHGLLGSKQLKNAEPYPWERSFRFSLDREVEDGRDAQCKLMDYSSVFKSGQQVSVIFIFCNEMLELLLRSVHSVLNRTPPELLKEILLVDDGSNKDFILAKSEGGNGILEDYVATLPKVKLIRTGRRSGIVQARTTGIAAAQGEIFVILDSHIETQPQWLEALIKPIIDDPTTFVMPHIDGIDRVSWTPKLGGVGCTLGLIWKVMEHAFTADHSSPIDRQKAKPWDYVSSPTMAGGLFAGNKAFFNKIGGYDLAMTGWGAENVEFSFRIWQCGGKLMCTPCSRAYHMFGGGKHYTTVGGSVNVNRIRTMGAWMDDFADLAWHVNGRIPFGDLGDLSEVMNVRKNLQCKDFQWFLDTVWPESDVRNLTSDVPYMGPLENAGKGVCLPSAFRGQTRPALKTCTQQDSAFIYFAKTGRVTPETNDETCLLHNGKWEWCYYDDLRKWKVVEIETESGHSSKLDAIVLSMTGDERALWKPWEGEKVLVQLMNERTNECLAAVPMHGSHPSEKEMGFLRCDSTDDNQLWLWTRYRVNPFWKNLRDQFGIKTSLDKV